MEKNLTVWTLLLCLIIGLALLLFNVISWTTYFVVVLIIAGLTFYEKKNDVPTLINKTRLIM